MFWMFCFWRVPCASATARGTAGGSGTCTLRGALGALLCVEPPAARPAAGAQSAPAPAIANPSERGAPAQRSGDERMGRGEEGRDRTQGTGARGAPAEATHLQHGRLLPVAEQPECQRVSGVQAGDHLAASERDGGDVGLQVGPVLVEDQLVAPDPAPALTPAAVGQHVQVACGRQGPDSASRERAAGRGRAGHVRGTRVPVDG